MKKRLLVALVALVALGALAASGCKSESGSVNGAEIYANMCASCHGPDGKPPEAMVAKMNVRDLTDPELRKRATPEFVEAQVRKGSDNKLMPGFEGAIGDAQIKAVSEYVVSSKFGRK